MAPTAPAEEWADFTSTTVERLRDRKVRDVPPAIVKQAQLSLDGVPDPDHEGKLLHNRQHRFESDERAAAFFKHMKNAGDHTTPRSSISVVIDENDKRIVRWKAGKRRGVAPA